MGLRFEYAMPLEPEKQKEVQAQQDGLIMQQRKLQNENRNLKAQQADLLDRQATLEEENERLEARGPGAGEDEGLAEIVEALVKKIQVLTGQQRKLSAQQGRLVELQNRLIQRQRKLEQENTNLRRRQERIEKLKLDEYESPDEPDISLKSVETSSSPSNPKMEGKLEEIKSEMQLMINQLTSRQENMVMEQTLLIERQSKLEEENEELRSKQTELQEKQKELERENRILKANFSRATFQPKPKENKVKINASLCELRYKEACFALLSYGSDGMAREKSNEICKSQGGFLANVYDKAHYTKLREFFIENDVKSGVWIGMEYNPQNFRVTFNEDSDNNESFTPYLKWNYIYPLNMPAYTALYLYIDAEPRSIFSGMVNLPPTWKYPYALCQFGNPVN